MKFTRREILATFLGAPFAMAACSSGVRPKLPLGEIVGQNVDLGHIIRESKNIDIADDKWQTVGTVIVGGGVAGLTAARKFLKKGYDDFVLLELEKQTGGTALSGEGEPGAFPWGAHYLPVPFRENTELIELLDEMQLIESRSETGEINIKEQFLCREPEERVFYKGRWYHGLYLHAGESEDDKTQLDAFQKIVDGWVNWRDDAGRRAFIVPSHLCSDDEKVTALDYISFGQFLKDNGLTSERLLWYCDYACRDDYGLTLDQTSAWAGLFYFCSRVRTTGEESQPFITFTEGNGRFVKFMASSVAEKIRSSHAVISIEQTSDKIEVICIHDGQPTGFRCKNVIYASPVFTAPYVIKNFNRDMPFNPREFEHNAWFTANLFLKDRPKNRFARDFPLSWDNVIYESPSLGYINSTHQKGLDYGPAIFTYYYPMCREEMGRTKLFNYTWRDLADVCLTDVSRAHPDIYELCDRIDIMRWGHAMISPVPGFIWGADRRKALEPYKNIHFAHSDLSGLALFEEAFYHGSRAADAVLT